MRISESEKQNIIKAIDDVFSKNNIITKDISLYLYGSRAKDNLRGGDIDLLFKVPQHVTNQIKNLKVKLSVKIQDLIGEQKIDIVIYSLDTEDDPFLNIISKEAVLLKQW